MNAPDAATWWLDTGWEVVTGRAVLDDTACVEPVPAGPDDADVADEDGADDGGADVTDTEADVAAVVAVDPEASTPRWCEPDEQAAPDRATMTTSARSFTGAHDRGPDQTPLSTSAISSPISDGLRPTRQPAFSSASILAAAVPLEPETMAPAWPIFFPGGAVTPAT